MRQEFVQDPSTKQPQWDEVASGTLGVPYVRRPIGCKINSVAPEAIAVWQRSSIFKLQYLTYCQTPKWQRPERRRLYIGWINDFYREVYAATGGVPDPAKDPTDTVDGCYINYCDTALNAYGLETVLLLYYGGNPQRLKKAKRQWDPLNYFQNAQSIPLTA